MSLGQINLFSPIFREQLILRWCSWTFFKQSYSYSKKWNEI